METERIGGGVYPTMALVNHSCDPNIVLIFFGRVALAVASRAIEPGKIIVWLRNRFISAGLEPVPCHTEKSCIGPQYTHFFNNVKLLLGLLAPRS